MAGILSGEKVKVTVEFPDGLVYDVTGMVTSVNMSAHMEEYAVFGDADMQIPMLRSHEVELTIRGVQLWKGLAQEKAKQIATAREWQCPYCGHINPREARVCGELDKYAAGCGGHRSFVYD